MIRLHFKEDETQKEFEYEFGGTHIALYDKGDQHLSYPLLKEAMHHFLSNPECGLNEEHWENLKKEYIIIFSLKDILAQFTHANYRFYSEKLKGWVHYQWENLPVLNRNKTPAENSIQTFVFPRHHEDKLNGMMSLKLVEDKVHVVACFQDVDSVSVEDLNFYWVKFWLDMLIPMETLDCPSVLNQVIQAPSYKLFDNRAYQKSRHLPYERLTPDLRIMRHLEHLLQHNNQPKHLFIYLPDIGVLDKTQRGELLNILKKMDDVMIIVYTFSYTFINGFNFNEDA